MKNNDIPLTLEDIETQATEIADVFETLRLIKFVCQKLSYDSFVTSPDNRKKMYGEMSKALNIIDDKLYYSCDKLDKIAAFLFNSVSDNK